MGKKSIIALAFLVGLFFIAGIEARSYGYSNYDNYNAREALILADINYNGVINREDVSIVNNYWKNGIYNERADVNSDGVVNLADRQIVNYLRVTKDNNRDGSVNIVDYFEELTIEEIREFGDVNNDGTLDYSDRVYVEKLWRSGEYEVKADFLYDLQINLADRATINYMVFMWGE